MPLEIKELVVRAVVEAESPRDGNARAASAGLSAEDREALLQSCVKEVLRILRGKRER